MSDEILEKNYENLLEQYNAFIETKNQKKYEIKMNLELEQNMEKAFREEFDNLKKLKAKKEREINLLKDNIKKEEMEIKNKYSEQLDLLKSKVEDAKSINEDLTKAAYKLDRKITMIPNENILKIKKSSPDKLSIEKLKDNIESLKNNINDLECIKDSLSKKLNECDISIENYETLLEEKRQKKTRI